MKRLQGLEKGFTVVELLVVAPIVILAIGAFLTLVITMTGDVIASRALNILTYNMQDALNRIEADTKLSTTFLATNTELVAGQEGQGFDDALENFYNSNDPGDRGDVLILNMLATSGNPTDATSGIVYLRDQPNGCSDAKVTSNKPLTYQVVYFVKDETLWRRTIMPAQYASTSYRCAEPWQRPSCSPGFSQSFCVTEDIKLVEGIAPEDFNVGYFTTAADSTEIDAAYDSVGSDLIETRASALEAATTVNVTLSAEQVAAGRTIGQEASIRATRLDTNASTIAPVPQETTPSAPQVSGIFTAPNKAVFNWTHSTGGNISYLVQYRVNGGSYTTLANTTDTTRTITANHGDQVEVRVRASNSVGTSSFDYSSVTIPVWIPLPMQGSWNNYENTYARAAYTKTQDGIVLLKGLIKKGNGAAAVAGEILANLPEGYRPSTGTLIFGTAANSASGRIDVKTNGDIILNASSGAWTSLDTVRFVPDGRYTRTTFTPGNGWTHYGGGFSDATYVQTDAGRVVLEGLVRSGTWSSGTRIFPLPSELIPSLYLLISSRADAYGYFGINHQAGAGQGVVARGVGSSYLSVNAIYHPASYTSWSTMSLTNGWQVYGGVHATPQYTKGSDNMVVLKGLVKSGGAGAITTLPVGYRPKERLLFTTVASDGWARVDIEPSGLLSFQAGTNSWLSFDNITFLAEQ